MDISTNAHLQVHNLAIVQHIVSNRHAKIASFIFHGCNFWGQSFLSHVKHILFPYDISPMFIVTPHVFHGKTIFSRFKSTWFIKKTFHLGSIHHV